MLADRVAGSWAPVTNLSSSDQTISLNLIARSFSGINGISFDTGSQNMTITNGILSYTDPGEADIRKLGSGTLILSGDSTYEGATLVNDGTLLVNGDNSGATGDVTVASGATLGGTGIIGDITTTTTFETGSTHSPGDASINGGTAIQRFGGDVTYQGGVGSTVLWELDANTISGPGTNFDRIMVGGDLSFAGATTIDLDFNSLNTSAVDWNDSFWGLYNTREWQLWGVTGSTSGFGNLSIGSISADGSGIAFNPGGVGNVPSSANFSLFQNGGSVYLRYEALPEPTTFGLLGLIMGGLTIFTRRRRAIQKAS